MNYKVTVLGAGRMGSALATVLFHKGFATTVWNRTAAKTEVLSRLGLSVAQSIEESVRHADIVVVSVSDYTSTQQLLRQPDIETALRGKILVQLSSGTPKDAREMDTWARRCGISYLDGAILGSPEWIGTPAISPEHFTPEKKSAEHSQIKFKMLRLLKLQLSKVWMIRIQKHIPFPAYGSRGHVQNSAVSVANPLVAKHP